VVAKRSKVYRSGSLNKESAGFLPTQENTMQENVVIFTCPEWD
jgi:hypothetical protein